MTRALRNSRDRDAGKYSMPPWNRLIHGVLRKHFQVRGGALTRAGRGTGAAGHLGGHLHGLGVVVDAHVDVHAHLELEVLEAARELGLVDACESDR